MRVKQNKRTYKYVAMLVSLAVLINAVSGCARGRKSDAAPNVILITLDTVRADHLGCYGYGRDTSPRIDALAKTATLYKRAVATSPWTVPTHASLFTGKFSFEHGAHGFKVKKGEINNANPLPMSQLTLSEVFAREGYMTGAFVANDVFLAPRWQLNQGFKTYRVERLYAAELNEFVFQWLAVAQETPFFLFINYMDAHRPYNTRPQPGLSGVDVVRDQGELLDSLYSVVMPGTGEVPAPLARKVIDQYDTAVRNLDEQIGLLIDRLELLGFYDNTVIILTSDHGEFFGEHHLVEHSKDLYEEVVSVPLIVKAPYQKKQKTEKTLVASTDIPYLILSQFSGEKWVKHLDAFPDVPGNHEVVTELYYSRPRDLFNPVWGYRFDRIRTAIYEWPYKYIYSSDGKHELFDLESNERETQNLLEQKPEIAERFTGKLQDFFADRVRWAGVVDQEPLSEDEKKRLRALGYVGD
jgi:arylsulfatase A-like enzyme